jgi:abortive infection bacteriophage resistance protein
MTTISRERAICMLYHKDYDKTKSIELLNAIEKIDLEICYKDDPCKPFLLYTNSIKADPYNYLTYQKITEAPEKNNQIEVETKKIGKSLTKKKMHCIFDYS